MRATIGLLIFIVVLIIAMGAMFYVAQREEARRSEKILEISAEKDLILHQDSVNEARFKLLLDSIRGVIRSQRSHDQQLKTFTQQIRKQNAEIQKRLNDLPDTGRPVY